MDLCYLQGLVLSFAIFYINTLLVFIIEIQTGALEIAFSDIKACMLKWVPSAEEDSKWIDTSIKKLDQLNKSNYLHWLYNVSSATL